MASAASVNSMLPVLEVIGYSGLDGRIGLIAVGAQLILGLSVR